MILHSCDLNLQGSKNKTWIPAAPPSDRQHPDLLASGSCMFSSFLQSSQQTSLDKWECKVTCPAEKSTHPRWPDSTLFMPSLPDHGKDNEYSSLISSDKGRCLRFNQYAVSSKWLHCSSMYDNYLAIHCLIYAIDSDKNYVRSFYTWHVFNKINIHGW